MVEGLVVGADGLGDVGGRDDLRVVVLRDIGQARHAALDVDDHHLDGAGEDGEFLLEEVARDRDAVADQDLVGGAADARQGDALGASCLGVGSDLRVHRGSSEHLGEFGLVAMDDDVGGLGAEHAKVGLAANGRGRAEDDVADQGGDPRTAPAIGQARAEGVHQDVAVVVVDAHVRAVEALDDHAVDAFRLDAEVLPDALALDRGELQGAELVLLAGVLAEQDVGEVEGDVLGRPAGLFDVVELGRAAEGLLVLDPVATPLPLPDLLEQQDQVAAMIGVGGGASGDFAEVVAGDDGIGVGAADPLGRLRRDAARAHVADAAADAVLAEGALDALGIGAGEAGVRTLEFGLGQHLHGCRIPGPVLRLGSGFFRIGHE